MAVRTAVVALVVLSALAAPAAAQSFDCAKAAKPDEVAVCDHRDLADLDVEMATLWWTIRELPLAMGERGAAGDDQRDFLKRRAACGGDAGCIERAYRDRIAAMKAFVSGAMKDYCRAIGLC